MHSAFSMTDRPQRRCSSSSDHVSRCRPARKIFVIRCHIRGIVDDHMTMRSSLISAAALLVVAVAPMTGTDSVVAGPRPDDAAVAVFDWDPGTPTGFLGVDLELPDGVTIDNPYGGYVHMARWAGDQSWHLWDRDLASPTFGWLTEEVDGPTYDRRATRLRLEFYPTTTDECDGRDPTADCYWQIYDVYDSSVGGLHLGVDLDGAARVDLGSLRLPRVGDDLGAFVARGDVVSATDIPNGRIHVDAFQIDCAYYEGCIAPPVNDAGVTVGAFSSGPGRDNTWSLGVAWPGRYTVFVRDTVADIGYQGFIDVAPGDVPTFDLDAPCFGMEVCVRLDGTDPAPPAADFHPVAPARVLDTRNGIGITEGPVRAGDGSLDHTTADLRLAERRNHEFRVTGVGGVPDTGVAAVLLNVTAVAPTAGGFISVAPRPSGTGNLFDDQNSYGIWPSASNLNLVPNTVTPNMVLARVGAGGMVRLHVYGTDVHVLADVAGWFGHTPDSLANDGFQMTTPRRVLDTRGGIGTAGDGAFNADEVRRLRIGDIPDDVTAVVLNMTAVEPTGDGFVTVWPSGSPQPDASNLNTSAGVTRPNLVVVRLGENRSVDIASMLAGGHLLADLLGYTVADGGTQMTAAEPFRVFDTRGDIGTTGGAMTDGDSRRVQIAGVGGVPNDAIGAMVNITVVEPSAAGFATVWPSDQPRGNTSNLNWDAGDIRPNAAIIGLGADGSLDLGVDMPGATDATAHVLIDVMGWLTEADTTPADNS